MINQCAICGEEKTNSLGETIHWCEKCTLVIFEYHTWLYELYEVLIMVKDRKITIDQAINSFNKLPIVKSGIAKILWQWTLKNKNDYKMSFLKSLDIPQINIGVGYIEKNAKSILLSSILENVNGEKEVGDFLYKNQYLLRLATDSYHSGESSYVLREYRLGSDFVADFLIVRPMRSLPPKIILVELEPPNDKIFTKDGLNSNRLAKAIKQVSDWHVWINKNQVYFVDSLKKILNNIVDPLYMRELFRKDTIEIDKFIFIGTRSNIKNNDKRNSVSVSVPNVRINTYDTFLDISTSFDCDTFSQDFDGDVRVYAKEQRKNKYLPEKNMDDMLDMQKTFKETAIQQNWID